VGDSIIEVLDHEGKLLTRDTVSIRFGNNYTYAIIPAYNRLMSKYMLSNSERERWLMKVRTDSAIIVQIPDAILPPISDRSSARFIALALDQAQSHGIFVDPIWLYNPDFNPVGYYVPQPLKLNLPLWGFPPAPGFNRYNPPRYQVGTYYPFETQTVSVYSPGAVFSGMEYESGQAQKLITMPVNFQAGKSYTIITNGTHGEVNDASELTAEARTVPLQPIPYEMYILDDSDGSARILTPEKQYEVPSLCANVALLHVSAKWMNTPMNLSIDGAVYRPDQQARNDYPGTFIHQTQIVGNRQLGATAAGAVRPVLAMATADLAINTYYIAYLYDDEKDVLKMKTQVQDTVFKEQTVRVRIAHLCPDLENIRIVNTRTQEVVVTSLGFEGTSAYIELPIASSASTETWIPYTKQVDGLQAQNAQTGQALFNIDLSYLDYNYNVTRLAFDASPYSEGGMLNYTVILSGRFHDPSSRFLKSLWGSAKVIARTTADGAPGTGFGYTTLPN
jgi:hypothetical protein